MKMKPKQDTRGLAIRNAWRAKGRPIIHRYGRELTTIRRGRG